MKSILSLGNPIRRSTGKSHVPVSIISVLAGLGVIVAYWAPAYLEILDYFGGALLTRSEALEWSLVAVGALGLGLVVYLAWQDTRYPAWRAAHGLPLRKRSDTAGR
jgi:hypothetical protein